MASRSPSPRRAAPGRPERQERHRPRNGGDSYRPNGSGRRQDTGRDTGTMDAKAERSPPPPRRRARRSPPPVPTEEQKQAAAKAEYNKLLNMRSGGTYIPPARLRALQAQVTDKSSKEYQRMAWEALKKSINGLINKVNVSNIKHIVPELFNENLIRGRGLFCRSMMKAQAASLPFTSIYAAFAAIVNTKLPQVGELLVKRLIMQFRKAFRRNDKTVCLSSAMFIAHLVNQQVVHEMLAAQMLLLLLQKPTDDSVEIAVGLIKEVGQHLQEMSPAIAVAVFDQFRTILHEADIDKRVQYMIEVLFQVRKDNFKDNPAVREELDLIEEEDQITHRMELDANVEVQDSLNIFKFDPEWEENEAAYKTLKAEILGEGSDDDDDDEDGEDDEDGDESSEDEEDEKEKAMEIKDQSNTDLVNLRKTIYLTIQSSPDPEECVHKLMKIKLPVGLEHELPSMIVECCSQDKVYTKYFGMIGERFAKINRLWTDLFEQSFAKYYETIHRYETNRLRNIARFFGHMFGSDAISWHALAVIHLNEEETTSASRIFIKIMFQEISEELGMAKVQARMQDETIQSSLTGIFPRDSAKNVRFSINYFTSIGMGALTEDMREYLANIPKPTLPPPPARDHDSDSDSVSSYSSYTGSSYSSRSRSRTPPRRTNDRDRGRSYSRTPSRRGRSYSRGRSYTRSPSRSRPRSESCSRSRSRSPYYSRSPSRGRSMTRSRSRSRSYSESRSRSRTPPHRNQQRRGSYSKSPPPQRPRRGSSYSRRGSPSRSRSRSRTPPRDGGAAYRARSYSSRGRSRTRSHSPRSRSRSRSRSYTPSRTRSPSQPRRAGQPSHPPPPRDREMQRGREGDSLPSPPPNGKRQQQQQRGSSASAGSGRGDKKRGRYNRSRSGSVDGGAPIGKRQRV